MAAPQSTPPGNPSIDSPVERDAHGHRIWRVGTLAYTTAGLCALFAWLLWGDFAWNMKDRAIGPVAQLMLRQFQASDFLVGLLVGSLPAAIGLIVGPIISVRSDNHRGRWGRRIPYLLIPTPIVALSMVGLAFTAPAAEWLHGFLADSSPGLVGCRLIVFGFFWTTFEIFQTIAQAVFGGLINDVVPQEVIGRFFGLFRIVSLFAAIVFNFWLIDYAEQHYMEIFLGLGILFGVGFALMCVMVKEGEYPPPPPPSQSVSAFNRIVSPIKAYVKECYTTPYYLWVFLALMLGGLASGPVNSFSVFYAKSIDMSMDAYGKLLVLTYTCSIILAYPLGWLADKFHPLRLGILSLVLYTAMMFWGAYAATNTLTFSIAFVAHGVIQGIYNTGTASIGQRLFPRVKFAQFASAAGIMGAFGYMILPPVLGKYLDLNDHAYRHTFGFSGALSLLALVSFLIVWRHFRKLGGPRHYVAPE
jgi:MFS family permease